MWSKLSSTIDANGNLTNYSIDPATGYLTSVASPAVAGVSATKSFAYNARGQLEYVTDAGGIVTKFVYDSTTELLLLKVSDYGVGVGFLNLTTTFGYDSVGNLTSVTLPNGDVTTATFDSLRRCITRTATAPFLYTQNFVYDDNGQMLSQQRQNQGVPDKLIESYTYSLSGKVATLIDASGKKYQLVYDDSDRTSSMLDAQGRLWQFTYDAVDRMLVTTHPAGGIASSRSYTDNGLIDSIVDTKLNMTSYVYDGHDRPSNISYADGYLSGEQHLFPDI